MGGIDVAPMNGAATCCRSRDCDRAQQARQEEGVVSSSRQAREAEAEEELGTHNSFYFPAVGPTVAQTLCRNFE